MITANIKVSDEIVKAKLRAAGPRILAQNQAMVTEMLGIVKSTAVAQTPIGPGHFGYHLRDTYRFVVEAVGVKTIGKFLAPIQGYWREFGTRGRFRKGLRTTKAILATGGSTTGGEAPRRTAHKALALARRVVKAYYNGKAEWWWRL